MYDNPNSLTQIFVALGNITMEFSNLVLTHQSLIGINNILQSQH